MISLGRKGLSLLLCGLLLLSPLSVAADTTSSTYVEIDTKAELDAIRQDLDGYYRLTADITFTAADFAAGGAFYNNSTGWQPIGSGYSTRFTGELDGNGHTITGLTIIQTATEGSVYAGLFGYAGGSIHDLIMTDTTITITGGDHVYAGCVVAAGMGSIEDVTVNNGNITIRDAAVTGKAGGIAGRMFSGSLTRCAASGVVDVAGVSPAVGGIAGQSHAILKQAYSQVQLITDSRGDCYMGGITGINEETVHASLAIGSLQVTSASDGNIGGVVGWNQKTVTDSLAMGEQTRLVSHYDNYGGIVGSNDGTVTTCYYTDTSCENSPAVTGVTAVIADQLTSQDTFTGWDFDADWAIGYLDGIAYPVPQSVVRKTLQTSLAALMITIEDPVRYTATSLEAVRVAQKAASELTNESSLDAYTQAQTAVQQAQEGLTEKSLTCGVDGNGSVDISGTNRYGQMVTLTATPDEGQVLSGFVLHRVFYSEPTVETAVSGAENATAYFRDASACTVLFRGKYGRIIDVQTVTAADELVLPTPPDLQGYTFVGWNTDLPELDLSGGCISVDAVYAIDETADRYTVNLIDAVSDLTLDEPLPFDACVKLTPVEKEGQTFSHWLVNGMAASTNPSYSLYVAGDDTVQAVYDADLPEAATSVQHTFITADNDRYTLNAVGQIYLPDDATVVEYGMLFAADSRCAEDPAIFTLNSLDCSTKAVTASSVQPNRRYLIYLSGVRAGATRYLRSYLVLRDADGARRIVYSPVTTVTMPNE